MRQFQGRNNRNNRNTRNNNAYRVIAWCIVIAFMIVYFLVVYRTYYGGSSDITTAKITEYNGEEEVVKDIDGFNTDTYQTEIQTITEAIAYAELATDTELNIESDEEDIDEDINEEDISLKYRIDTYSQREKLTYSIFYLDNEDIYLQYAKTGEYLPVKGELIEKLPHYYIEESFYCDFIDQIKSVEIQENQSDEKSDDMPKPLDEQLSDTITKKIKNAINTSSVSTESRTRLDYEDKGNFRLILCDDADLERCEILVYDNGEIWFQNPNAENPYTLIVGDDLEETIGWIKAFYDL